MFYIHIHTYTTYCLTYHIHYLINNTYIHMLGYALHTTYCIRTIYDILYLTYKRYHVVYTIYDIRYTIYDIRYTI